MEDQEKVPVFKASLVYGAIVGLASIVFGLILYFVEQSLETWAMIASTALFVVLIVVSLVMFKKEYGKGFARFGRLVLVSFLVGLFASILSSLFSFALFEMDKGYLQDTKYFAIEKMDKQFEKMDARYQEKLPDDQYDRFEAQMKKQRKKQVQKIEKRSSFALAFGGVFSMVFLAVITGLIAGIFIKKEPSPSES
jgi:ABC-type sugar transport system permease subunit